MSPEQTRGSRLDYRTDLYSLGVMIYESATGTLPFSGTSVSIMSQHFSAAPDPPRTRNPLVSVELDALIRSLLSKKPDARPGSGAIVAQALQEEIARIHQREGAGPTTTSATVGPRTIGAGTGTTTELATPVNGQGGQRTGRGEPEPQPVAQGRQHHLEEPRQ